MRSWLPILISPRSFGLLLGLVVLWLIALPPPMRAAFAGLAVVAGGLLLAGAVTRRALPAARGLPALPAAADLACAREIALGSATTAPAHLALAGDKRLLFSASRRAFLMYGIVGGSWIALGDPVGDADEHHALAAAFVSLAARYRGRAAFYRADAAALPIYAALGLRAIKLGEEAHVALPASGPALSGGARANLRHAQARAAREGCCFEVIEPGAIDAALPEVAAISAAWLAALPTREKRFSLGRFEAGYVRAFHLALVRCHGVPVAFATFWPACDRSEAMVDLMRRVPEAPYGSMDFLLASLMGWAASRGYARLNLGMAPLAGFDDRCLPWLWRCAARLTVAHAGRLYNFAGLRRFKAKFGPAWRPKYLVTRGGLDLPVAIVRTALLVAGGWRGLIGK